MDIQLKSIVVAIVSLASLIVFPVYATQTITPPLQNDVLYVAPSQTFSMPINYSATSPEGNNEAGLGLRVHFDSSKLSFNEITQALQSGIQPIGAVQADTNNYDGDASTDKFFILAWVDIAGNWPSNGYIFPLSLFTSNFTANAKFTGVTHIAFTASGTSGGADFSATPQIICRKPEVSLSANTTNTVFEGGQVSLNVTLDQPLPEACGVFSVTVNASGTATAGSDYQNFSTNIIFLPNESTVPLTINTLDDSLVEADESLVISLAEGNNYTLSTSQPTQMGFNIISDDMALALSISPFSVVESAEGANSTVTLTRSGYLNSALDVVYQISGTATQGQDFSVSNATNIFHFDAGQSTASLDLSILNDNINEGDETVILTLQASENYPLPQNSTVTLTIKETPEICVDIDGNGSVDALTDGIILARYLLGYRDAALIENSLAIDATRTSSAVIQSYIENQAQIGCYDIDGNGGLDPLTDGVLLIRYLSNYQGDNLIQDAIGQGATRSTATAINAYIATLLNK